jgi:nucleoside-diphosphate-sugar epimerase
MSSSPSTRFDGNDINGLKETELTIPKKFLQAYAESKCKGEEACMAACDGKDLLTVAVAPHQVYGPRDMLFLHNFLLNAKRLRVFRRRGKLGQRLLRRQLLPRAHLG